MHAFINRHHFLTPPAVDFDLTELLHNNNKKKKSVHRLFLNSVTRITKDTPRTENQSVIN